MILITGASGNVGREVVKQSLAVELKIRATFHSPAVAAQAPAGLEGVFMDFAKPDTIRPALHGSRRFFWWTADSGIASIGSEFRQGFAREWGVSTLLSFQL